MREESYVTVEVEIGLMQLQALERQEWTAATTKRQGEIFPRASEKAQPHVLLNCKLLASRNLSEYISVA